MRRRLETSRDDRDLRHYIVEACREMRATGINQGTSGNIGVRVEGGILLTPSGLPYDRMTPDDIVFMDWDGGWTASESTTCASSSASTIAGSSPYVPSWTVT